MTSTADSAAPISLSDLSEEEILARVLPLLGSGGEGGIVVGPGDDAAVIAAPDQIVITTDSMVRGRDWRDEWSRPAEVAEKLGAQNISDIAAMGGAGTGAVLALTADPATTIAWLEEFAAGLGRWCREAEVQIVGGDLSSAPEGVLHVALTMWGSLQSRAPVLRSGARPGDVVAVCGSLGWSSAGLALYASGTVSERLTRQSSIEDRLLESWRAFHRAPRPPWESGPVAAHAGATSMIDVSDGFVRDAGRIAAASGVRIALDRVLLEREFVAPLAQVWTAAEAWQHVLGGGEEHSLVATFPDRASVPHTPEEPWRVVGEVTAGAGVTLDGEPVEARGWDHFRP